MAKINEKGKIFFCLGDLRDKSDALIGEVKGFRTMLSQNPKNYLLYMNDFLEKREDVKNALEDNYNSILNLLQMDISCELKQVLETYLENLFDLSYALSSTCVGSGYNVTYDIFHTIKLLRS